MQSSFTINIDNNLIDSDELEVYLRNQDDSSQPSDFGNLSNSQTSTMRTKIETLLKSFYIEHKRLNRETNILQF